MIRIYGIYDLTSEALLGTLMTLPNDAAARRLFADSANSAGQGHILHDHLDEFVLVNLAEFNIETGEIIQVSNPHYAPFGDPQRVVITGKQLLAEYAKQAAERAAGQTEITQQ